MTYFELRITCVSLPGDSWSSRYSLDLARSWFDWIHSDFLLGVDFDHYNFTVTFLEVPLNLGLIGFDCYFCSKSILVNLSFSIYSYIPYNTNTKCCKQELHTFRHLQSSHRATQPGVYFYRMPVSPHSHPLSAYLLDGLLHRKKETHNPLKRHIDRIARWIECRPPFIPISKVSVSVWML